MLITAHLKKGEITTTTVTLDGVLWAHPVTSAENNVPVKKKKNILSVSSYRFLISRHRRRRPRKLETIV